MVRGITIPLLVFGWGVDAMAVERNWLTPYNFVQNNPIERIDPTGMLDTKFIDEFGNTLADIEDGSNAIFVIPQSNISLLKTD